MVEKKLKSRKDKSCPFFFYVQSDKNTFFKIARFRKSKASCYHIPMLLHFIINLIILLLQKIDSILWVEVLPTNNSIEPLFRINKKHSYEPESIKEKEDDESSS